GPECGCSARPRTLEIVVSPVSKAAMAGRRPAAVLRQAAHPACAARTELAYASQPIRVGADTASREARLEDAAARRGGPVDTTLRRHLHRAVGVAGVAFRLRRPPRRRVPELEIRVRAARPLRDCRAAPRRSQRRLRGVTSLSRTARPRDAARRF